MVWSFSSTSERPLRSSSSLPSMPEDRTPISVATTKMPPSVTASITTAEAPAGIGAHGAGVERAHQRFPHGLAEIERPGPFGRDAEQRRAPRRRWR